MADRVETPGPPPGVLVSEETLRKDLGSAIRALRHERGLTLVQLAERADLSHSFLSLLERGLARPSMPSLHRIAQALGTTQPALMSTRPEQPAGQVTLVPAGAGVHVDNPGGTAQSLVVGDRAMYPMLFEGAPAEFGPAYSHDADEFVYVISGAIEMEIEGEGCFVVDEGDSLYYPAGLSHRWRGHGDSPVRVLFVQERRRGFTVTE